MTSPTTHSFTSSVTSAGARPAGSATPATSAASAAAATFARVARASADVVDLPAVATLDWCEGAAKALTRLHDPSMVAVMVATLDARGGLRRLEAAGVAGRGQPYEQSGPAIRRADPDRAETLLGADDPRCTALRSRLERLALVGWEPGDEGLTRPLARRIGDLPGGESWRTGPVGQLWSDIDPSELFAAFQPLGRDEPGRGLIVYIATGSDAAEGPAPQVGPALHAVLPLLEERALMSIGAAVTTANRWLTVREQLVLEQLILGKTVRQIASDLDRSPHTVHDHVKSLHRKLNASSRGELIARALGHATVHGDPAQPGRATRTVETKGAVDGADGAGSDHAAGQSAEVRIGTTPRLVGAPHTGRAAD